MRIGDVDPPTTVGMSDYGTVVRLDEDESGTLFLVSRVYAGEEHRDKMVLIRLSDGHPFNIHDDKECTAVAVKVVADV